MRAASGLLLLALTLSACESASVVGGPHVADVTVDITTADTVDVVDVLDANDVLDASDVLDAVDVSDVLDAADAPTPCRADADCAGHPDGAVCDVDRGRCVQCVPRSDTCAPSQHCDAMSNRCVAGCRADEGCAAGAGDAGALDRRFCEAGAHACVECLRDDQCPSGTLCVGNVCTAGCTGERPCPTGQSCCAGACVDPQSNVAHCGGCDRRCAVANAAAACANGHCAVGMCTAPFDDCDGDPANGCEANVLASASHCGRCGNACTAGPHAVGRCEAGRCATSCEAGFADCDGNAGNGCEAELGRDAANCGACGTRCDPANGVGACVAGRCAVASCRAGYGDCDGNAGNGCEVDQRITVSHCGRCDNACPSADNAFPGCLAGRCVTSCVAGFLDCDGDDANGCEADVRRDVAHCGGCGRRCAPPRGVGACTLGVCSVARCDADARDCNGLVDDGCESLPASDVAHCGACGNRCSVAGGAAACVRGVCGLDVCASGRGDCDGSAANGCEVDTVTDVAHCGACGNRCALPNATASCAGSACRVAACAAGFADCDGVAANGCEVSVTGDVRHCGRCGAACATPNADPACAAGRCVVASCRAGFVDCDADAADGCEVNAATDVAHCGACGNRCPARPNAAPTCAAGACGFTCAAGFADCDGDPANGCEVSTASDPRHCGACGRACGTAVCASGACQCGNGRVDAGEECDDGASNADRAGATCRTDCRRCGACGGGAEGAFRPTGAVMLNGGVHAFTTVTIPAGVVVTVTGAEPLRIYATGAVEIDGALVLDGGDGSPGIAGNGAPGDGGGGGGGGGRAGGRGGYYPGSYAAAGPGSGPGGGAIGQLTAGAGGGGGGGGHASSGGVGGSGTCCATRLENASYAGGLGGGGVGSADLTGFQGGSGGAGGMFGGADNGSGGSGGGGGGAVMIVAPSIRVGGRLVANGGRGGDAASGYDGGGGGGGAGGFVWLRATTVSITGTVEAVGGSGGTTTVGVTCCIGGVGGRGSDGRVILEAIDVSGTTRPTAIRAAPTACRVALCP